jgi:crotonobetainyl-CoA:carnitine CoA-transferase CaiB-like acyl-CoA transferase
MADHDFASVDLPLEGVRVVSQIDGSLQSVGRFLADLGAEVVRVESTEGSPARRSGVIHNGSSLSFALRNANTRSVASSHDVAEALRTLLATADIFVSDAVPFTEDELHSLNPRLVTVSLTDFGLSGPRSSWLATPDVHFALSSVLSRSGLPEVERPLLPPEFLAAEAAAAQAVWVTMLTYMNALRAEVGDFVDFSINDALIQILDPGFGASGSARAGESLLEVPRGRPDARDRYPIFPALDGWVRICVLAKRQWQGMFEWLGRPEQFADPIYDSIMERFKAARTLYPLIGQLFATKTQAQIVEEGQALGVPTAAILSASQVLDTDAYALAGSFETRSIGGEPMTVPSGWFEIDDQRVGYRTDAPAIGADTNIVSVDRVAPSFTLPAVGERPFDGIRVLDLGVIVVGAELGRLFGDYGADVIKIESASFPDGSRQADKPDAVTESSAWGHRNKRSLGLNLRSEQGRRIFRDLVAKSDVVLTNFKPGTMESLGFGYAELARINPRIILSESSAFGNKGPWSSRLGYGPLVRASAGLSGLWNYPEVDGGFGDAITIFPDHTAARLSAVAITALLLRRSRTGKGGRVSSAQVDVIFGALADRFANESVEPGTLIAEGNVRGLDAPRGLFKAAGDDEWIVVDPIGDIQFAALGAAIDKPGWATDNRFATAEGRLAHTHELTSELAEWLAARSPFDAADALQAAGVPAGAMVRVTDFLHDAHISARGVFASLEQPGFDQPIPTYSAEAISRHVALPLGGRAPRMAEDTRAIMADLFGTGDDEVDRLIATGDLEEHAAATATRKLQTA